ncbi:hypothetical protein [Argonema antarcticum]|uniref:hypothetical protein n=1 Tax=Argonema antarcticum TaxID=2942763 RepID=UPI00201132E8|nr:hypothetical protein [Argonema antarcticum]MCL1473042.1 hypothetical protein [Argonema antarcticum A004/B2]
MFTYKELGTHPECFLKKKEGTRKVSGQWSVVSGQLSVVSGQWSVVSCQLSVVSGHSPTLPSSLAPSP